MRNAHELAEYVEAGLIGAEVVRRLMSIEARSEAENANTMISEERRIRIENRRMEILALLDAEPMMPTAIAEVCDVSDSTARSDIKALAWEKLVRINSDKLVEITDSGRQALKNDRSDKNET